MQPGGLTAERLRELLTYDTATGVFRWRVRRPRVSPGDIAGSTAVDGGIDIKIHGKSHKAGRLAWLYVTGEWPQDLIDHKNGLRSDNRFENLRQATRSQNCINTKRYRNNSSGYRGVSFHRATGRWAAQIRADNLPLRLGEYETAEQASEAYAIAAAVLHGDFRRLSSFAAELASPPVVLQLG